MEMNIQGQIGDTPPPPKKKKKMGATQNFWAAREIWPKPVFKEVLMFFYFFFQRDRYFLC